MAKNQNLLEKGAEFMMVSSLTRTLRINIGQVVLSWVFIRLKGVKWEEANSFTKYLSVILHGLGYMLLNIARYNVTDLHVTFKFCQGFNNVNTLIAAIAPFIDAVDCQRN